jgi:hypothetical protein
MSAYSTIKTIPANAQPIKIALLKSPWNLSRILGRGFRGETGEKATLFN